MLGQASNASFGGKEILVVLLFGAAAWAAVAAIRSSRRIRARALAALDEPSTVPAFEPLPADWKERRIEGERAAHGEVRAPWEAHPNIPRYSMGWRMGYGEDFIDVWLHWWAQTMTTEEARLGYFRRHAPHPSWLDWAACRVWDGTPINDEEGVRRLEERGIGTVAAWKTARDDAWENYLTGAEYEDD